MGYRIVVVGATGNVGREMLNILDERQFPIEAIEVLASRRSLGTECMLGDKTMKTKDLDTFDFSGWDIALFAVGSDATKKYAPISGTRDSVLTFESSSHATRLSTVLCPEIRSINRVSGVHPAFFNNRSALARL